MAKAAKRKSATGKTVTGKKVRRKGKGDPAAMRRAAKTARRKENREKHREALERATRAYAVPEPEEYQVVTPEILEQVLAKMATGQTLKRTCRILSVCEGTVRGKFRDDTQLFARYTRAKELMAEAWADNIDEEANDLIDYGADGANVELGHIKHKADVKKWLMGKYHVRSFGDRVTAVIEGGEVPVETINRNMTPEEAMASFAAERKRKTS